MKHAAHLLIIAVLGCLSVQASAQSDLYLRVTENIDFNHPEIQDKVAELHLAGQSRETQLRRIYEYVRDSHTDTLFSSWKASDILKIGGNSCHQRSILFVALCRAVKLPARLHWQQMRIRNFKLTDGTVQDIVFIHGIAGVLLDGMWFLYEPVGNDAKWRIWVQREENNTLPFKYGSDCLYEDTEKVTFKTLPISFADHFEEMMTLRRRINSGDITF